MYISHGSSTDVAFVVRLLKAMSKRSNPGTTDYKTLEILCRNASLAYHVKVLVEPRAQVFPLSAAESANPAFCHVRSQWVLYASNIQRLLLEWTASS